MTSAASGKNLENNPYLTQGTKSYIQSVLTKTGGSLRNFTLKDYETLVQTVWRTEAVVRKVMFRGLDPGPDSYCPMLTDKPKANPQLDPRSFRENLLKKGMLSQTFTTSDYEEYTRMIWKTNTEMRKGAFDGIDPGPDSWIPEGLLRVCVEPTIEEDRILVKTLLKKSLKFDEKHFGSLFKKEVEKACHDFMAPFAALEATMTQDEKDALVAFAGRLGFTADRAKDEVFEVTAKIGLDAARHKAAEITTSQTIKSISQKCAKCEKSAKKVKLLVCSRCKLEHYCSTECQIASWPTHKLVCVVKSKSDKGDKKS